MPHCCAFFCSFNQYSSSQFPKGPEFKMQYSTYCQHQCGVQLLRLYVVFLNILQSYAVRAAAFLILKKGGPKTLYKELRSSWKKFCHCPYFVLSCCCIIFCFRLFRLLKNVHSTYLLFYDNEPLISPRIWLNQTKLYFPKE